MLLREHRFYYECSLGKKVRLLSPDAPVPVVPTEDGVTWDVWEFNSEEEAFSKEAQRLGLVAGPPVSLEHGWDITNQKHQAALMNLLKKHTPKLVVMASASRPWGSSLPRTEKDVRAWLNQREKEHIPLMHKILTEQTRTREKP